jgi:hypothetical protein
MSTPRFVADDASRSLSRISGPEATSVRVPPRIAAKPIGMSSRDTAIPVRSPMRSTTGRNSAAAPMFCMNALIAATAPEMTDRMRRSVVPPTRSRNAATSRITPTRSSAAPRIITAMIEMTAFDEKPAKTSAAGTSPARPTTTITRMAATSMRTTSVTNSTIVPARMASTASISGVRASTPPA